MGKLIDAAALMDALWQVHHHDGDSPEAEVYMEDVARVVEGLPDGVKPGRWDAVYDYSQGDKLTFECSECGGDAASTYMYCPWCGARMDGEDND